MISCYGTIVNKGEWLWSPVNFKGENNDVDIDVKRSTTAFCSYSIYVARMWDSETRFISYELEIPRL